MTIRCEVDGCQRARLDAECAELRERCKNIEAERADLQRTFDLQWTRMGAAIDYWSACNPGNDLVMPDLGVLLQWLVQRAQAADAINRATPSPEFTAVLQAIADAGRAIEGMCDALRGIERLLREVRDG